MIQEPKIWFDGKLVNWADANVHVMTHTLHYGLGVFEGVRCYKTAAGPAIFRLQEHTDRLFDSAHIVGMEIPFSRDAISDATRDVVRANGFDECYIRPIAFLGDDKRGLNCIGAKVHAAIVAWKWGAYLGEEGITKGIRVKVSSYTRHHVNISMTKAKVCGNYVNSILAKAEAVRDGYEEAVMLDPQGNVAEGSGENIFVIRGGKIATPPATSVLEGITRDSVIKIAQSLGLAIIERAISRDELYIADEAFFTGTAAEVTPIREVDGRKIGAGTRGPITEKIQSAYFSAVRGELKGFGNWLERV